MKRVLALLLALGLSGLWAAPTLAADYPLEEKLRLQLVNGSGLNAQAAFSFTPGGSFTVLDGAAEALLRGLLDAGMLKLRYIQTAGTDRGLTEASLSLSRNGEELAWLRYSADRALALFSSSLLGAESYAAARGDPLPADLALGGDARWPDILPILLSLSTGDNEWSARAATLLQSYSARLSVWLQSFTAVSLQRDAENRPSTRTFIEVPPAALKAQIRMLLVDLFSDAPALSLLRERLSLRQSAYLDPGLRDAFLASVDKLSLSENLTAERVFDDRGTLVFNSVTLPMGGFRGIDTLHYVYQNTGESEEHSVALQFLPPPEQARGPRLGFRISGGPLEDGSGGFSWKGSLSLLTPDPDGEGFTVGEGEEALREREWTFNLFAMAGEESYDLPSDTHSREFEATLAVTPPEGAGAQHLSAKARIYSQSNTRSPTRFSADLRWEDQESGAGMDLRLEGASAPPWTVSPPDASSALRMDLMPAQQLSDLRERLSRTLLSGLSALAGLLPLP